MARRPLQPVSGGTRFVLGLLCIAIAIGAWALAAQSGLLARTLLPGPAATARAGWSLFTEQDFGVDVGLTVARVAGGFAIAAVLAIPLGVVMGAYKSVEAFFGPLLVFARYLPAAGFLPLLVLWFGINEGQKMAMIFIVCFFQMVLMIAAVINNTPRAMIEVAYTLGTSAGRTLRRVMVPSAAPQIAEILRQVLGWTWAYVVFAELIGSARGVGHMIGDSQSMIATDQIIFGLLVIAVIAVVVDGLFRAINRSLFKWSGIWR